MPKKKKHTNPDSGLPADPRDYFVRDPGKLNLEQLAQVYNGQKKCSLSWLKERSAKEEWYRQREEYWAETQRLTDQKTREKIAESQAKTLTQLNKEHNELIEQVISMGKGLLSQYVSTDEKTGKKKLVCKSNEYRAVAQTLLDLIHAQRLFHNFEPNKPMAAANGDKPTGSLDELIRVIKGESNGVEAVRSEKP